jgi:cytochrome c553
MRHSSFPLLAALAFTLSLASQASAESVEDKAALCMTCHGEQGKPIDPLIPVISGQHQGYLYLQLRDYKLGNRVNEQMTSIVQDLPKEDMLALAEYFSQQQWPNLNQPRASEAEAKRAETTVVSGQCGSCHGETGEGNGTQPRIKGQGRDYILRTLTEFRDKQRKNNPWMTDLMGTIQPDDIAALAAYYAGR